MMINNTFDNVSIRHVFKEMVLGKSLINFFSHSTIRVCLVIILKNVSNLFNNLKIKIFKF